MLWVIIEMQGNSLIVEYYVFKLSFENCMARKMTNGVPFYHIYYRLYIKGSNPSKTLRCLAEEIIYYHYIKLTVVSLHTQMELDCSCPIPALTSGTTSGPDFRYNFWF